MIYLLNVMLKYFKNFDSSRRIQIVVNMYAWQSCFIKLDYSQYIGRKHIYQSLDEHKCSTSWYYKKQMKILKLNQR